MGSATNEKSTCAPAIGALLALLFISLIACSSSLEPPQRPQNVPEKAMWLGGADGGAWVVLQKRSEDAADIYFGHIYGDQAGEDWYVGRLKLVPALPVLTRLDDPETFGAWDGDSLHLADGRVLDAIDDFSPFQQGL